MEKKGPGGGLESAEGSVLRKEQRASDPVLPEEEWYLGGERR